MLFFTVSCWTVFPVDLRRTGRPPIFKTYYRLKTTFCTRTNSPQLPISRHLSRMVRVPSSHHAFGLTTKLFGKSNQVWPPVSMPWCLAWCYKRHDSVSFVTTADADPQRVSILKYTRSLHTDAHFHPCTASSQCNNFCRRNKKQKCRDWSQRVMHPTPSCLLLGK